MTDRTTGASRFYKSAVATSALPLLALCSAAAATPAVADTSGTALTPKLATDTNIAAAQAKLHATLATPEQLAAALPARFTQSNFQAAHTGPTTYKVKSGDTLSQIARDHDVSLSDLLNWNSLKVSSTIYPDDVLYLDSPGSSNSASAQSSNSSGSSYSVKRGDTLSAIAAKHGISLSTLLKANGLSMSSIIHPGQTLKLTGTTETASVSAASDSMASTQNNIYKVKSGDTLSGVAASQGVSQSTLLEANSLSADTIIYPGQQLKLSVDSTSSVNTASSASEGSSADSYTVKSGDTLSGIAARSGVGLATILQANDLTLSSSIFPGQTIRLSGSAVSTVETAAADSSEEPNSATSSYKVKSGDTLSGIAAKNDVSVATLQNINGLDGDNIVAGQSLELSGSSEVAANSSSGNTESAESEQASSYTVKSGDTLSGIAARNGLSLNELLAANGMQSSSEIIQAGQTLNLSGSSSVSTASGSDEQLVGDTFLGRTYPDEVVANANDNKQALLNAPMPSRAEVREMVQATANSMGVDPSLALAHAQVESGFDASAVSPANAIGPMQVIPSSGEWASQLVGRDLNLMDPQDNITAGMAIIRHLQSDNPGDTGIAGYYQGAGSVADNGMYDDTKDYVDRINSAKGRY